MFWIPLIIGGLATWWGIDQVTGGGDDGAGGIFGGLAGIIILIIALIVILYGLVAMFVSPILGIIFMIIGLSLVAGYFVYFAMVIPAIYISKSKRLDKQIMKLTTEEKRC